MAFYRVEGLDYTLLQAAHLVRLIKPSRFLANSSKIHTPSKVFRDAQRGFFGPSTLLVLFCTDVSTYNGAATGLRYCFMYHLLVDTGA